MKDLFDISPLLDEKYAVWPSDVPLKRKEKLSVKKGHSVNLSAFEATAHLGAHANGARVIDPQSPSMAEVSLEPYLGLCEVVEVKAEPKEKITPEKLPSSFLAPRVLIRTNTANQGAAFVEDYAALDPKTIEYLHEKGVILIGIDTPGIDLYTDCQQVLAQKCASKYNLAILECLLLKEVPLGVYELIALPLKLAGFEASPVRAILRKVT